MPPASFYCTREGKIALTWTRLSCTRFTSNKVRLALFVQAYNLGNFPRRFALPREAAHWSIVSMQLELIKNGARIVPHSHMTILQVAEAAAPRKLFPSMLPQISSLGSAHAGGARLEPVWDGVGKQGGISCGTTVP